MAHSELVTSDELSLKIITNNLIINIGNVFRNRITPFLNLGSHVYNHNPYVTFLDHQV